MRTVAQLLDVKGHDVHAVSPRATVFEALEVMAEYSVGALLVMDGDELVGIVSERDYARKVILLDRGSRETEVREIMTADVLVADPQHSIPDCMALMTKHRFRHLPVVDDGKVVGIVSIGDIVKSIIHEQEVVIEELERYISS